MIGVLTCLWRRPDISRIVLKHYAGYRVVAVRSPEDPEPLEDIEGVEYVEYPNAPLSDKWNAGMLAMKDCDAVMIVGSDDFVSHDYIERVECRLDTCDMARTDQVVMYDTETSEAVRGIMVRMGAGRILPRSTLDRLEYRPWPFGLNKMLDSGMDRRLHEVFKPSQRNEIVLDSPVLSIKSATNIWSFRSRIDSSMKTITRTELDDLIHTHYPTAMALTKKTVSDTPDKTLEENPEGPKTASLIALKNIPASVAGTKRRVYRGQSFKAKGNVQNLISKGLAKKT